MGAVLLGAFVGWLFGIFHTPQDVLRWVLRMMGLRPRPILGEPEPHPDATETWWHIHIDLSGSRWFPDLAYERCRVGISHHGQVYGGLFVNIPTPESTMTIYPGTCEVPLVTRCLIRKQNWRASALLAMHDVPAKVAFLTHDGMVYCGDRVDFQAGKDHDVIVTLRQGNRVLNERRYRIRVPSVEADNSGFVVEAA